MDDTDYPKKGTYSVEWPSGEPDPVKCWLSTIGDNTPLMELERIAKFSWRIEPDYQERKQELGLGHFEGRGRRGFIIMRHCVSRPTGFSWPNAHTSKRALKKPWRVAPSVCATRKFSPVGLPRAAHSAMSPTQYAPFATS